MRAERRRNRLSRRRRNIRIFVTIYILNELFAALLLYYHSVVILTSHRQSWNRRIERDCKGLKGVLDDACPW